MKGWGWVFSLANIGLGITLISSLIGFAWLAARWKEGERRDAIVEASMFALALIGGVINRWATYQSDQASSKIASQLQIERGQLAALSQDVAPRHLSSSQMESISSAFAGSGDTVTVWRCISMESAINLMNDFIATFQQARLKFGPGGVSTQCENGILVTFNPTDEATYNRLNAAFQGAGIRVNGQKNASIPKNSFSILIGGKTTQSP